MSVALVPRLENYEVSGSIPHVVVEDDHTEPDQILHTQATCPRCMTCGRRQDLPTSFERGIKHALNALSKEMHARGIPMDEVAHIILKLQQDAELDL